MSAAREGIVSAAVLLTVLAVSLSVAPSYAEDAVAGPLEAVDEIVFACRQMVDDPHWYANFGYFARGTDQKVFRARGSLCKLDLETKAVTTLLDDPEGSVRDPQVHYDRNKILFSYRKGGSYHFHLYEIGADGSNLRQLTDGPFDDIEPTYVADGGIVFCSSRCNRWVNCWMTQVAVLYRCDGDGGNIRRISANLEHDNTPWPLPDGRILHQRWEYVDRSQVDYHHLWTMNPDGTGQMVYYGNFHPGTVMIDAKPIPGSDKVVSVFSPLHGRREHDGAIAIVSPKKGPDDQGSARHLTKAVSFRDPYPLSEDCILVAQASRLCVMDGQGEIEELYRLPKELADAEVRIHEPRPLQPRPRERVIEPRVDRRAKTGRLVLMDVYNGRNMAGVERGDIKKLLVLEGVPMPIHFHGGMQPLTIAGTFTLERILGTVPVEPDGSAFMELPALRSLFFVALDEQNNSVKRMQSFVSVMPGETTSCVGCHEPRTAAPQDVSRPLLQALGREPDAITPIQGIPDVFDFPRDIQPVLDKHCLECHDETNRKGGVLLTGDRGPVYSHSYYTLASRNQIADGQNRPESNRAPRTIGTSASPLMKKITGDHHDVTVSPREENLIRYWIESGASFPGTYAALDTGMIGWVKAPNDRDTSDTEWPSAVACNEAVDRRCNSCHGEFMRLPGNLSDGNSHRRTTRNLVWNLTRPDRSLMVLAPLSRDAGGLGLCRQRKPGGKLGGRANVFTSVDDADYQKILALCVDGKDHLETNNPRFDMPGFRPPPEYIREMKRYGILSADLPATASIDPYETDRRYWASFDPAG